MIPVLEHPPVIRLWSLETRTVPDPLPPEFGRCLDEREREQAARFTRACDRRLFICAHALRRALLARTFGLPAEAWRFTGQPLEKPRIDQRIAPFLALNRVDCNLTHTDGLVAAVVADGALVGVDAEILEKRGPADPALAALVCTPREQGILASLAAAPTRWWEAFLGMWVRKEAVAKAVGLGLSMSLTTLETVPDGHLAFYGPVPKDEDGSSGSWCLWSPRPAPLHLVAVAARTAGGPRPPFLHTIKTWWDLRDDLV